MMILDGLFTHHNHHCIMIIIIKTSSFTECKSAHFDRLLQRRIPEESHCRRRESVHCALGNDLDYHHDSDGDSDGDGDVFGDD